MISHEQSLGPFEGTRQILHMIGEFWADSITPYNSCLLYSIYLERSSCLAFACATRYNDKVYIEQRPITPTCCCSICKSSFMAPSCLSISRRNLHGMKLLLASGTCLPVLAYNAILLLSLLGCNFLVQPWAVLWGHSNSSVYANTVCQMSLLVCAANECSMFC